MKCFQPTVCCIAFFIFSAVQVRAATLYADSKLEADITDGTYSIEKRAPGGNDGSAYKTIQAAVHVMEPGDVLLLRDGVFKERRIRLTKGTGTKRLQGAPDAWFTIRSYPGEWAKVDGEHYEEQAEGEKKPKTFSIFDTSGAGENYVKFWRFAWFEVTGGGPALKDKDGKQRTFDDIQPLAGKGFHFWPATDVEFDHMYVHDNYGGSGPNGGAGISIQGERYKAQRVKITHCWLSGNGWPGSNNGNLSNIVFFADYQWRKFPNFDTTNSLWGNEVSYNLLENSAIGFKHKGAQFLCMNHEGSDMSAKERGSRVHHNIMRNCHEGMLVKMDFMQIHNNIAENCGVGIQVNDPPAHGYRELFHNVCYNNTARDCKTPINFQKGWSEAVHNYLTPPYHPYFYLFNNILHSKSEKVDADNSTLALYPRYTKDAPLEMSTLHMASNLFLGRVPDADAIRMGMHNFSAKTFVDNKWAHDLWAMDAPDIFQGTEGKARFLPKADLKITADKTYADAGCGAKHPYLDGVEMPKYIGAVDPADADWVDEVENLKELGKTLKAPALK